MKPPPTIVVGRDGQVSVEGGNPEVELGARAGRYRAVPGPPGLLVLARVDALPERRAGVLMSGEILGPGRVAELMAMIGANGWSGELTLVAGEATRRLRVDQAALRGAYSNVPTERLGEVMVAHGVITADQLARCVLSVSPERRFGEIAIDHGVVDRQRLFEMLQAQAERIFQNALLLTQGSYAFVLRSDDEEAPATTLHLPIQGLLMHSVQRMDEMAHFRERIASSDLCPVVTEAAARLSLQESLRPVAMLSDGTRSILDIGRELRMDEFAVTKRVMQLLQIGFVELKDQLGIEREGVERIVRQLNDVMREINDTVERHGGGREMRWTLNQWIKDAEVALYFGDDISLDGHISPDATLEQLKALKLERPGEALHRAAHELVSFAMFSASPTLTRDSERALSKWVNQRVARMRL